MDIFHLQGDSKKPLIKDTDFTVSIANTLDKSFLISIINPELNGELISLTF